MWQLEFYCFAILPLYCVAKIAIPNPAGTFWHISDLHVDFYYTQQSGCPWSTGAPAVDPGPFGDYKCDCPWKLVNSTLHEMQRIQRQPDFILFTGDNILHTREKKRYLSTQLVLETEANLTKLIRKAFPNTKVFSVLGNHDFFPADNMPVGENDVRRQLGDIWQHWMNEEQLKSFEKAGYYTEVFDQFGGNLRLAMLNTNLWDLWNPNVNKTADPGGQFAWLESLLQQSRKQNQRVYIVGHIPPGTFELSKDEHWLYPEHNRRYVALVQRYADVIAGQFFAHNHRDSFRIFHSEDGTPISTLFITPSVTPHSAQIELANNPGIRLFEYDRKNSQLVDYVQYYFDLVEGNALNKPTWQIEYRATTEFQTDDIRPASMHDYLRRLKSSNVCCDVTRAQCEDNSALQRFSVINSVSYNFRHCDVQCQRKHLCAMGEVDYDRHKNCLLSPATCRFV